MPNESLKDFLNAIDTALAHMPETATTERAGLVETCRDGVMRVSGLPGLRMGEVIRIDDANVDALVMEVDRARPSGGRPGFRRRKNENRRA